MVVFKFINLSTVISIFLLLLIYLNPRILTSFAVRLYFRIPCFKATYPRVFAIYGVNQRYNIRELSELSGKDVGENGASTGSVFQKSSPLKTRFNI